ncbi:Lipoxygenase y domain-containing protein 1 [Tetrabaena socialis]|uniref:Lipoxygenase y domain-containing protein 1 n=1 Tax=Tetrabaena socialis TaxID=47790 RepID=A0A2J8AJN0_9CHLO|nr:Lipoxygenase y domain-containing protein 1 [Tetrabaena socialis]|eukprot:PNH12713.1 Lipoxygenase y domain-containing protein 1 [Tetrabaena socialis]
MVWLRALSGRARKHYQQPTVSMVKPDAAVFGTLNELENLMRATLGALANFNEDEKMILTKQFRREEQKARLRGDDAPPGLMTVAQFRHAWKKFSIRVSEEQAHALFIRYGCDTQGLLPYDLFATKLLSSPARLLALEPEQKGPYKANRDTTFRGKITYRYCRKPVFPPSDWDGSPALRSARKPKAGLQLEFVYGYAGVENTASNIFFTGDGRLVYYQAAVGIIYDPPSHTQKFFQGHDDDIRCMALHPDRFTVATGQVASSLDGSYDNPFLCIWDVRDPLGQICRIPFPSDGAPTRYVVALAFSGNGKRLVAVTGDNRHTVNIFHWKSKALIHTDVGHNGQPPQVFGVAWNNFLKDRDKQGSQVIPPNMFVTYGVKHLKFWTQEYDERAKKERYKGSMGKFGRAQVQDVLSAIFVSANTLVTGAQSGDLLMWDVDGTRSTTGQFGCCIKVIPAHGPGVPAPSIHDGTPTLQGVRCMALRASRTELVTGGADGQIICWDITTGDVGRVIKTIQLQEPGEKTPAVFRSLDALEGGYDMVAGTQRCEIWELSRDVPEPLTQGHSADVLGLAFHPKKPHKYATACNSMNVFMWNAKRRQLVAKVNIGIEAQSVAFSPNGAHLAVGTITGLVKVLLVENLTQKVAEFHTLKEMVHELKYSPDGTKLAAGSHDNFIDIYDVTRHYARLARCSGHSSYITHLDWSLDGRIIQSNCGAYELLYFEAATGKQIRQNQRDAAWHTWTCTLGFPVMGVWRKDTDGTDINALSNNGAYPDTDPLAGEGEVVVTAGDDGRLRLFNYPCVVEDAPDRTYLGHCSHVMNVRFSPDNRYVVSVGGNDRAGMQWRVLREAQDEVVVDRPPLPDVYVYEAPRRVLVDVEPPPPPRPTRPEEEAKKKEEEKDERDRKRRESLHAYEITTVTSDIKGAATDANVFMVIYGDKNTSGEIKLENGPDNFARGRTDVFTADLLPLGDFNSLRIGHDAKGNAPRWHLDHVIVRNKTTNSPPLVFPCGQWFATDLGDNKTVRLLRVGGPGGGGAGGGAAQEAGEPKLLRYKVVVKTSDVKGAGTDANVTLQMFGEHHGKKYQSPELKMENSSNNYERGQTDVFEVEAAVGELKYIRIGHDNRGFGPSWHLQEVVMSSPSMADVQFVANRWLSEDEGDRQTYVTLYPVGAKDVPLPHKYQITVFTSDLRGAGTDANVSISFYGTNTSLTGVKLENSKNNFERNAEDIFFLENPDLGSIPEIEIGHDNAGLAPGWHCAKVIVEDQTAKMRYAYPCDRWFDKGEEDGLIRRRLKVMEAGGENTDYTVTVVTSDIRGAGTDANVYLEIMGENGGKEVVGKRVTLDNSTNNFERAQVDKFLLKRYRNCGNLTKIRIGHDNAGMAPGWHCDHIEVADDATGVSYFFPCNKWFDKGEDDRAIERLLPVAPRDPKSGKAQYKITVHTSDIKFGGTDANVFIEVHGDMDGQPTTTGRVALNNSKNNFERAQVDVFSFPVLTNVGVIKRIVDVLLVNTGQQCYFYYNQWLSRDDPPYKTEVELFPTDGEAHQLCRYTIITQTSDERGAGTDANVSCMLMGDKANTPTFPLENSRNNFEKGQRDEFILESIDIGTIKKLQIGHDNKGLAAAWRLDHVEVIHQARQETYYFLADQWLDAKSNTLMITLEPANAAGAKQVYKVSVRTSDKRGAGTDADVSIILMGAIGNSPELKLESGKNDFEKNQTDNFNLNMGHVDLGEIQKIEIGFATQQSAAGKLGGLFGQQWGLESVEVTHMNSKARQFFYYDDWISGDKRRVQLVPGKAGGSNAYKVRVKTSDIRGAGTDANVTLAMFGKLEDAPTSSGIQKLDNSSNNFEASPWAAAAGGAAGAVAAARDQPLSVYTSDIRGAGTDDNISVELHGDKASTAAMTLDTTANNFERGSKDIFKLSFVDIGELQHIIVKKDNRTLGLGGDWHLQSMELFHPGLQKRYFMLCNDWFKGACEKKLEPGKTPANGICTYRLVVTTSDCRGAGTDADVTCQLFGDKGDTGERKLDDSKNNFERNMVDTFFLQAPDVEIVNTNTGEQATFPYHNWIDKEHGLSQLLTPDRDGDGKGDALVGGPIVEYTITTLTTDIRGAGTDANVFIEIHGDKGAMGETRLDNAENNFERGRSDTFKIKGSDIGNLKKVVIRHDNSGIGSDWHLSQVEVTNPNTTTFFFPCNDWLRKVTAYTSDLRGAGTDSDVFLTIYGPNGDTGERLLDNSKNNFERNMVDNFVLTSDNIGAIQKLKVRSSGTGLGAAWHLNKLEVQSTATSEKLVFPFAKWIDDKNGLEHILYPDRDGDGIPDPTEDADLIKYRVVVYTSDIRGAGTDANVFIELHGDVAFVGKTVLDTKANNFERNTKDEFQVSGTNVGELKHIIIGHDNSGVGSAWHVQQVEVYHPVLQKLYVFPCNEWLEKSKELGLDGCKRTLVTGADAAGAGLVTYRVIVKTSDMRGAGTDSDVFLTIYGPKGDTGERTLDNSKNNFERKMIDTFILTGPDVGELERVRVRSSGTGLGAAWHLDTIDVVSSATNTQYAFPFRGWIDDKNGLDHTINRDGLDGPTTDLVEYRVTTYTSDIRGAGTDANVFIEMHGELGSVGQSRLDSAGNNFERGQVDNFVVRGSNVGDVQRVVIWHDDKFPGSDWHCQQVEVFNTATQKSYFFPCNDWLRKTKEQGDKSCRKELIAGAAGQSLNSYKVEVQTSDVRGAGTDSDVHITVFGAKGDTGARALESSANDFERGKLDSYFFMAPDIGTLQSCQVVCSGTGLGAAWHLAHVTVTNTVTAESAKFVYNDWLDAKKGWAHTLYADGVDASRAAAKQVEYELHVFTSDVRGAGTDGDVFLQLKGAAGAMGETKLENAANNFERNREDVFTVQGSDIGKLTEVTVRLVERGLGAAWHLQQVEVLNKKTGERALFRYNDWLQGAKTTVTLHESSSEAAKQQAPGKVRWKVTTHTADVFGAGTDAKAFVQLHGPGGMLNGAEIALDDSKNNFERNDADQFFFEFPQDKDCGTPLLKLVVERGSSVLPGSDWMLDYVEVVDLDRGHTYRWKCGAWFNGKEGLKKEWSAEKAAAGEQQALELVESPAGVAGAPAGSGDRYRITTATGDVFGAGTDAQVHLQFTDAAGTDWGPNLGQQTKAMFERKKRDEFFVTAPSRLADMAACRVWIEHPGLGDNWHLDHVLLTHLPSQREWRFDCKDWVPKGTGPAQGKLLQAVVARDVPLEAPAPDLGGPDTAAAPDQGAVLLPPMPRAPPRPLVQYDCTVVTGTKFGSGTDALASVELLGSRGSATHTFGQSKTLFENGSRDRFRLTLPDVGNLQSVRAWHDGSGFGADWFLDRILLEHPTANCKWEAVFNAWVKGGEANGRTQPARLLAGAPQDAERAHDQGMAASMAKEAERARALEQQQAAARPPRPPPPAAAPAVAAVPASDTARVPYRPAKRPGDDGIAKQVLRPDEFARLPQMQPGDSRYRFSNEVRNNPEPPPPLWQKHTAPYAQDQSYGVTYYHNPATQQSTYDKPPEYAEWERKYDIWLASAHELGKVVRKHGLEAYVGIFLGHKHFDIDDDERVLVNLTGGTAISDASNSMPLKARVVASTDQQEIAPYCWVLRSGECMEKLIEKFDVFMPDIVSKLQELRVEHLLGVALRYDRAFRSGILQAMEASAGKKLTLLETTNPYKRRQRFQVIDQHLADADSNMVSTFWGFDPDVEGSCDYTYACFKIHGNHSGYWGHAWRARPPALATAIASPRPRVMYVFGAGTNAQVCLQFTDPVRPAPTGAPTWGSRPRPCSSGGRPNEFFVTAPSKLADMAACRVWIEHRGLGDNWHLDHVLLTHLPSQREWRFDCKDWVPKGTGPAQGKLLQAVVARDVPLEAPTPDLGGLDTAAAPDQGAVLLPPMPRAPPRPLVQYDCTVVTGTKFGSGTDALASVELLGSRGSATHTFEQSKTLFENGSRDRFRLTLPDVGNLQAVRAWHDGSGFGADWFLDRILLEHPTANCKWEAVFNAWVKGGEANGRTQPARLLAGAPQDAERAHDQGMAASLAKEAERARALEQQQAAARPPRPPPPAAAPAAAAPAAAAVPGSDTARVPDRPAKRPGDDGIAKQVLRPNEFARLPQMQPGDARYRFSNEVRNNPEPPPPLWQKHTAPYAQDQAYGVTYYHNPATQQSTYDKPPEYAEWERKYDIWLASVLN